MAKRKAPRTAAKKIRSSKRTNALTEDAQKDFSHTRIDEKEFGDEDYDYESPHRHHGRRGPAERPYYN